MESFDALLKVVMIGDTSVGKTCLILRYTQDIFRENFLSTIGESLMVSAVGKRSNADWSVECSYSTRLQSYAG